MHQNQKERARAKRADTGESNMSRSTSTEKMQKLGQQSKVDSSSVASESAVVSTSRAARRLVFTRIGTQAIIVHFRNG